MVPSATRRRRVTDPGLRNRAAQLVTKIVRPCRACARRRTPAHAGARRCTHAGARRGAAARTHAPGHAPGAGATRTHPLERLGPTVYTRLLQICPPIAPFLHGSGKICTPITPFTFSARLLQICLPIAPFMHGPWPCTYMRPLLHTHPRPWPRTHPRPWLRTHLHSSVIRAWPRMHLHSSVMHAWPRPHSWPCTHPRPQAAHTPAPLAAHTP